MKPGDIVKYANPAEGEEDLRFYLIENRGDRVEIVLVCDLPFPPVEVLPIHEITTEEDNQP